MEKFFIWHFILCRWYRKLGHKSVGVFQGSLLTVLIVGWSGVSFNILGKVVGLSFFSFTGAITKWEFILLFFFMILSINILINKKRKEYIKQANNYRLSASKTKRKRDLWIATFAIFINPLLTFIYFGYILFDLHLEP